MTTSTTLGLAYRRDHWAPFGIRSADRLHHMLILGQTGTGKSTLLRSMARQDVMSGQGVCVIDPHGDLVEDLHHSLQADHIYWNVADARCPYGYNPIPHVAKPLRNVVASGFVDMLRHQWSDAWGPRMEHLLRWGVLALLDQPSASIADLMPLYMEREFRQQVVANIEDEECRRFWTKEYPALSHNTAGDGVAPIANKLSALLSHPIVRHALTEPDEPLRFRRLMDEGQTLLVNLGKGQLGTEVANVLGGLVLTGLRNAAFSRSPGQGRRPYFALVDEFHNFTSDTLAESLSELRKYGLGLTLAGQYFSQATKVTREAILGNVGSTIAFRLGVSDVSQMARYLQSPTEHDLLNQPNHQAYCRLLIDGTQSRTFSMKTHFP